MYSTLTQKHNKSLLENNTNALEVKHQSGRDINDIAAELRLLKDRIGIQDEQKTRFFREVTQQVENLSAVVLKAENDLYNKLREQKKSLLEEAFNNKDQWRKIEEMRMEKIVGDNDYLKSLMDSLERKVKSEMHKRLTADFDSKNWMEMQFHGFKDEIVTPV